MKKNLLLCIPFLLITSCNQSSNTFNGYEVISEEEQFKFDFDCKESKTFKNYNTFENDIDELLYGYNFYTIYFDKNIDWGAYGIHLYSLEFNYNKNEENYYNSYVSINFVLRHKDFEKDIYSDLAEKDGVYGYLGFECKFLVTKQENLFSSYEIKYIKPKYNKYDKLQVVIKGENSIIGYIDLKYVTSTDFKRMDILKHYLDFNLIHHFPSIFD